MTAILISVGVFGLSRVLPVNVGGDSPQRIVWSALPTSIVPSADKTYDLGSTDKYWDEGFFQYVSISEDLEASGSIKFGGLLNCDTIDSDATGLLSCGTDASGTGGVAEHGLLNSDVHPDVLTASASEGSIIIGNSTPVWSELVIGASNSFFQSNGTTAGWYDYVDQNTTYTGGDFLTLTGTDFDIDIAAVSNGDITHLSTADAIYDFVLGLNYLSTVDISANTNLGATNPLSLNGDTLTIDLASASGGGYLSGTDYADLTGHMASANAHIDWTADQGATNIHAGNYTDTNTTYTSSAPIYLEGTNFRIELASTSGSGYLSNTDWDTFNAKQSALTFELPLINVGNVISASYASAGSSGWLSSTDWGTFNSKQETITANDPLTLSGGTLSIDTASAGDDGVLTAADWSTFNGKQATITDGTNLTFAGTTLNVDDPFTITTFTTTHASVSDDLTIGTDDISFIGGVASISSTLWIGGKILSPTIVDNTLTVGDDGDNFDVLFNSDVSGNGLLWDANGATDGRLVIDLSEAQIRAWNALMPGYQFITPTDPAGTYSPGLFLNLENNDAYGNRLDLGWGGANGGSLEMYSKNHDARAGQLRVVYGGGNFGYTDWTFYNGSTWLVKAGIDKAGRFGVGFSDSHMPGDVDAGSTIASFAYPFQVYNEGTTRVLSVDTSGNVYSSGSANFDTTASIQSNLFAGGTITFPNLVSCDTIDTNASGLLACGTDATSAGGLSAHALLGEYHSDIIVASPSAGDLIIGEGDSWKELAIGASNSFLMSDGASVSWNDLNKDLHGYVWTNVVDADITNTLTASELVCTDCINATEIEDIYFLTAGDEAVRASISDSLTISDILHTNSIKVDGTIDFPADSVAEADIDFDTACAAGNHYYLNGNDLACEADDNTTYTATAPLFLTGTVFDIELASTGGDGYLSKADWDTFNAKWDGLTDMVLTDTYIYVGNASNDPVGVAMSNDCTISNLGAITCDHDALANFVANEHIDWTGASAGTIHATNYVDNNTTYTAGDNLTLTGTDFDLDDPLTVTTFTATHASISDDLNVDNADLTSASFGTVWGGGLTDCDNATTSKLLWSDTGVFSCGTDTDTVGGGAVIHGLLNSDYFNDVLTASVSGGSIIVGGETTWQELTIGASGSFFMSDGVSASWNDIGSLTIGGDLTIGGGNLNTGNIALTIGDATTDGITFTTDGTGNAEFTFPADVIGDADIDWGSGAGQIDLADFTGGISGAVVWDFGGATSFEIPNSAAPTVDAAGETAIDTTGDQLIYFSVEKQVIVATRSFGFMVNSDQMASSSWSIEKQFREPITITEISCRAKSGTSFQMELLECDANGANCSDVDASITCAATATYSDGSLANPTIDALDTVVASMSDGDITGAVETGVINVWFKMTAE